MDKREAGASTRPQAERPVQSKLSEVLARVTGAINGPDAVPPPRRPAPKPRRTAPNDRAVFLDPVPSDEESIEFFPVADESVLPRFPIGRSGYDRDAVDAYIAELESALLQTQRERDELKTQVVSRSDIAAEIERLGAETSAILITAHTKAEERMGQAEFDAQTRIADSTSYATALREEALSEQRRIETENARLRFERERLLGEMQRTANALSTIATEGLATTAGL